MRLVCSAIRVLVAIAMAAEAATAWAEPPLLVVPAASQTLHLAVAAPQGFQAEAGKCWQLVEVDHTEICLPVEVVAAIGPDGKPAAKQSTLLVNIPPSKKTPAVRNFRLEQGKCSAEKKGLRFTPLNDKSLELREGEQPVLVYNHGVITNEALPVKETRRSRACFVHPLYGLHGEVLTDAFPKDHYHHLGMFWAWPHIFIEGKEYDLWMYKNIKQKFVSWLAQDAGPAAAQLAVENGWFIGDKKVATERVWLRTFPAVEGHRAMDVDLVVTVGDKAITLIGIPEKSYGGLNFAICPTKGYGNYRSQWQDQGQLARHQARLGRPDGPVCRGPHANRCCDLRSAHSSRLPAHLAHAALRRALRGLAGGEEAYLRAGRNLPFELPGLDPRSPGGTQCASRRPTTRTRPV